MASLHPQFEKDCLLLGHFELCQLLLMRDANYPWFILVPDRENIREIYQLGDTDQQLFLQESVLLSRVLMDIFNGDKLNIAALGNVVPQLHIHHIVRYEGDPSWPAPVWGKLPAKAYTDPELAAVIKKVTGALPEMFTSTHEQTT